MNISKEYFGIYNGQGTFQYRISNGQMQVVIAEPGCIITAIIVPGANGVNRNIVLGYTSSAAYADDPYYMGATVGRYAGRISNASFPIGDTVYKLAKNEPASGCQLHGGVKGFNQQIFRLVSETSTDQEVSLTFHYASADNEEGYPGNLDLWVIYTLTAANELTIRFKAATDKATAVNLTNHSYFNFSGKQQPAMDHLLYIDADSYVVSDEKYIPTGELKPVAGSSLDFTLAKTIAGAQDLRYGYNDCFVLNNQPGKKVAVLSHAASGISMDVATSYPGLLLYSSFFLSGDFLPGQGVCLETQFFPDSINQPAFPSTILMPGETYDQHTTFSFRWG